MAGVPYWRLSGFYFFYFATIGALVPYLGLYLKSLGFSAAQIGETVGALVVGRIVAPNLWGWVADHTGKRLAVVRQTSLFAMIACVGILFVQGYVPLLGVMLIFGFFWSSSLPQLEAVTLSHLRDSAHAYPRIRVWGSIGFILTVGVLGFAIERLGIALLPGALFFLVAGIWGTSLLVPEQTSDVVKTVPYPLRHVVLRPSVMALFAVCFLMQVAHGPYYTFYSIYLKESGYSPTLTGGLWSLGVITEVGLFLVMHRILPRFGLRPLMLTSLWLAALRWSLIGIYVDNLPILVFAQTLHAATFGIFHAVAIQFVHRYFVEQYQGRGQALYNSLSAGAGGFVGSMASGYTWESMGPAATFLLATLASLLAFGIAWRWISDKEVT
jgi:PPP family 3-phenylpropionic acid transporter